MAIILGAVFFRGVVLQGVSGTAPSVGRLAAFLIVAGVFVTGYW